MKFITRLLLPVVMVTTASAVYGATSGLSQGLLPLGLTHNVAGQTEPLLHTFASNPFLETSSPGFKTFMDELYNGSWDKKDDFFLGYTPLHRAALAGNYDAACELLKQGANKDLVVSDEASCPEYRGKKACELVPEDGTFVMELFVLKWLLEDGYVS